MKAFVVMEGYDPAEQSQIKAIFSTAEKAKYFVEAHAPKLPGLRLEIEEHEIDAVGEQK